MEVLVAAFNQKKALVGATFVIVKTSRRFVAISSVHLRMLARRRGCSGSVLSSASSLLRQAARWIPRLRRPKSLPHRWHVTGIAAALTLK